jgi:endogenous inhibitor of DNA gyrase (YacG/DUF329 family)
MPFPKLNSEVHSKLVESASTGCTMKCCAEAVGINSGTLRRWLSLGKDPANQRHSALRTDILRARAFAEMEALKSIQLASTDPVHWRAAVWFLEHSIRGRWLKSATAIYKPEINVSMADIARDLNDDDQDGQIRFRSCSYCGMEFEVRKDRRKSRFCSKQCRQLDTLSIRNQGQLVGVELIPAQDDDDDHDEHPNDEISNGVLTH